MSPAAARASTWRRTSARKLSNPGSAALLGDALVPAVGRQDAGGDQRLDQRRRRFLVGLDEVADAALQAAGARAAGLGAEQPAPQFAPLLPGQAHRERGVGRFEQMMALVEHVAGRHGGVVEPAQRRLRHDQRVVGDDEAGVAGGAHVLLDKAAAEMRAGGMDAFAAPVGQRIDPAAADQLGRASPENRRRRGRRPRWPTIQRAISTSGAADCAPRAEAAARRILVIQQAEEILAALADHDAAALLRRVGIEPVEFAGDLALQVAGIGRDPDRALVLLGPQAGRRDIAEGLADAGAGLGEHRAAARRACSRGAKAAATAAA